jgi:acetyl-CoA C-acetyltransferase/acetyl-CoA acyltransferase
MSAVAVIGVGQTTYGLTPERTLKALFADAVAAALADVPRGLDPRAIDEAYIGSLATGGSQLGNFAPLMAESAGLTGCAARRVENACASSGFALRDAVLAVASGRARLAIAGGIEKMSDLPRTRNRGWLGVSGDVEWERLAGTNFPGIYAMIARRHMHEFGTTRAQLAGVAVKNRGHALANPKAQVRRPLTLEEATSAPMLADPLGFADACGITDGASAAILCRLDDARGFTDAPVAVVGSGAGSDVVALHDRASCTRLEAVRRAARAAYDAAGVGPDAIDLAEVHDCFSIAELLAYADLGFCREDEVGRWVEAGETHLGGRLPVNVSGGLIAKGHPIGATGTGQIVELVHQLRGTVAEPERRVAGARFGLAHNVGGSGGSATVHILQAPDRGPR